VNNIPAVVFRVKMTVMTMQAIIIFAISLFSINIAYSQNFLPHTKPPPAKVRGFIEKYPNLHNGGGSK